LELGFLYLERMDIGKYHMGARKFPFGDGFRCGFPDSTDPIWHTMFKVGNVFRFDKENTGHNKDRQRPTSSYEKMFSFG